jgi:DNA-binding response OmpR family regulator
MYFVAAMPHRKEISGHFQKAIDFGLLMSYIAPMSNPICILLVEDHHDTRETLQRYLHSKGYEVLTAASIGEAFTVASTMRFDILVSDIGLPDGSGIELLMDLKRRSNFPAIAISGFFQPENEQEYYQAGFDRALRKPFYPHELSGAIQALVTQRTTIED